jgi:hypothetical protein
VTRGKAVAVVTYVLSQNANQMAKIFGLIEEAQEVRFLVCYFILLYLFYFILLYLFILFYVHF